MNKKIMLLLIGLASFHSITFNASPLKPIVQEIDDDLRECKTNQDCINQIDKHLANLKHMQESLKTYHMKQLPYALPSEAMNMFFAMNFLPVVLYVMGKFYNVPSAKMLPSLTVPLSTLLLAAQAWSGYGYRTTNMQQLNEMIKFLEDKKKVLEQE